MDKSKALFQRLLRLTLFSLVGGFVALYTAWPWVMRVAQMFPKIVFEIISYTGFGLMYLSLTVLTTGIFGRSDRRFIALNLSGFTLSLISQAGIPNYPSVVTAILNITFLAYNWVFLPREPAKHVPAEEKRRIAGYATVAAIAGVAVSLCWFDEGILPQTLLCLLPGYLATAISGIRNAALNAHMVKGDSFEYRMVLVGTGLLFLLSNLVQPNPGAVFLYTANVLMVAIMAATWKRK